MAATATKCSNCGWGVCADHVICGYCGNVPAGKRAEYDAAVEIYHEKCRIADEERAAATRQEPERRDAEARRLAARRSIQWQHFFSESVLSQQDAWERAQLIVRARNVAGFTWDEIARRLKISRNRAVQHYKRWASAPAGRVEAPVEVALRIGDPVVEFIKFAARSPTYGPAHVGRHVGGLRRKLLQIAAPEEPSPAEFGASE
jgi:ribosome-binding protein aMBF1 (putative translation factor)